MRLSAKPIINFANVNQFDFGNQWIIRSGEYSTLYFQIIDLDQNELRYVTGLSATTSVVVTFPSIDDAQLLNIPAIPDPNDSSIWKLTIGPNQTPSSGNVRFSIQEGSSIKRFSTLNLLSVEFTESEGSC